jgi:hypothetical protein
VEKPRKVPQAYMAWVRAKRRLSGRQGLGVTSLLKRVRAGADRTIGIIRLRLVPHQWILSDAKLFSKRNPVGLAASSLGNPSKDENRVSGMLWNRI